ncbi:hypothetical protein [Maribellus maritimus]|uniref:hypothetical protein n=1 Tax=Maribellus maritimus TaxID=2870838 RepID=UPI001EE9DF7C|nr:hypothetical protein [Maribellus maritimus]MCG6189159.1 hypothetical protein [Maribellus maritimus]
MAAKLLIFAALTGLAIFLDNYFEKNPVELNNIAEGSGHAASEHGTIYLFSQSSSTTVKSFDQRIPDQRILQHSHNKLLQKYHQLRSYQMMKKEAGIQNKPLILTCCFLLFRSYHFTFPDDDIPLIA